jgi:hypothetical protein
MRLEKFRPELFPRPPLPVLRKNLRSVTPPASPGCTHDGACRGSAHYEPGVTWEPVARKHGHGQAGCWLRQTRTEVVVRPAAIVMEPPGAKDLSQMVFAEGNQIIEALPTETSE